MEETLEDSLAAELLPDVLRGTAFVTMAVVNGVGDFVSSLAVGWLWATVGAGTAFGFSVVLMIMGSAVVWTMRNSTRRGIDPKKGADKLITGELFDVFIRELAVLAFDTAQVAVLISDNHKDSSSYSSCRKLETVRKATGQDVNLDVAWQVVGFSDCWDIRCKVERLQYSSGASESSKRGLAGLHPKAREVEGSIACDQSILPN